MPMEIESELIVDIPYKYQVPGTAEARVDLIENASILNSDMQTLVIPVNCVGVMGAGLARQFALRYPEVQDAYEQACKEGIIKPGQPAIFEAGCKKVVCFPTKNHWATNSDLKWIEEGLKWLQGHKDGIKSIAFPMLGCGLGKLPRHNVLPIIYDAAEKMQLPAEIYI